MPENAENTTNESTVTAEDGLIFSSQETKKPIAEPEHQEDADPQEESSEESENDSHDNDNLREETSEDDEPPLPEPDEDYDETKKKKNVPEWVRKRLERERAAAEESERKSNQLKAELEAVKLAQSQPKVEEAPAYNYLNDSNRPMRDNFTSDEEYFLAVSDYRDAKRHNDFQQHARNEHYKKAESEYQKKIKETTSLGKEKYEDFDEVTHEILRGDFPSNRAMGEAMVSSPYKEDILYYLSKNIDLAKKIGNMNPIESVREITKIELRFDARKKSNITKAPKIIEPLNGKGGLTSTTNTEKMTQEQYEKWYSDKYKVKRMV